MGWIDDQDFLDLDDHDDEEPTATCRYCGKTGLFWQDVGFDKRALFEPRPRGSIARHECNRGLTPKKIIDSFDDIA